MTRRNDAEMRTWQVHDAKSRFSALLDACASEGPQLVTRRGTQAAVIVPIEEWRRLTAAARPTLKDLLLTERPRANLGIPERGRAQRRRPMPAE